jgi:hypothetical protein
VLNEAKTNGSFYELEVATARVENRFPHLTEDDESCVIEREDRIQHELKSRENKRTSYKTFRKLGRQIRGQVKPNTAKKSNLSKVTVPETDGTWTQIIGKYDLEDHLMERSVTLQCMRRGFWWWDCGFVIYGSRSDDVGAFRCWDLSIEMETCHGRYAEENTGRVKIGQAENN